MFLWTDARLLVEFGKERLDINQKIKCHWMMASKKVSRFLPSIKFTKFNVREKPENERSSRVLPQIIFVAEKERNN